MRACLRGADQSHTNPVHDPEQQVSFPRQFAPAGAQASHVPPVHERLQHSKSPEHGSPPGRHASHVPAVQCWLQQSASALHVSASGTQQPTPAELGPRHSSPGQQGKLSGVGIG